MPPYEKTQIFQKNTQKPRQDLKKPRSSGKNPAVVTLATVSSKGVAVLFLISAVLTVKLVCALLLASYVSFIFIMWFIFSALHGMPARTSDKKGVCLSVCQTRALSQNGRKMCSDFYTTPKNTGQTRI